MPCKKAIRCPGIVSPGDGNYDFPIINFSSEEPDRIQYVEPNYGPGTEPPVGRNWRIQGCLAWCISTISREDAMLCAARQQIFCRTNTDNPDPPPTGTDGTSFPPGVPPIIPEHPGDSPGIPAGPGQPGTPGNPNDPPTPPPEPPTQLFGNDPQTCTYTCPDGTVLSQSIAAGQVFDVSKIAANRTAYALACQQLRSRIICGTTNVLFACADPFLEDDTEYSFQFTAVVTHPPVTWSKVGGEIPPQLTLETDGRLHGFPDTAGDYNFTVRATDAAGVTADIQVEFHVMGLDITSKALPTAGVDEAYNYTMPGKGGATEYWISDGSLPTGLTMDDLGVITGTPTVLGDYSFTVSMTDGFLNVCSQDLTLKVGGVRFLNTPPGGQECDAINFQFSTDPPAAQCTFSGSVPAGLTLGVHGLVTGTLRSRGGAQQGAGADPGSRVPATYVITATAPDGTHSQRTYPVTITPYAPGDPNLAIAVQDLVWSAPAPGVIPGFTLVSAIGGGNCLFVMDFTPAFAGPTPVVGTASALWSCSGLSLYALQVQMDWSYTGTFTVLQLFLSVGGVTVWNTPSNTSGSTGLVTIPALTWTPTALSAVPNISFAFQGAADGPIPPAGKRAIINFLIRPLFEP